MSKTEQSTQPKKIRRFSIGTGVIFQIIVIIGIVGMLNYLGFNHFKRWDFSRTQKYALSEQTKQLLKDLKKEVTLIIYFSIDPRTPGSELYQDVKNLVTEYQYASDKKISVEIVDPFKDLARAQQIASEYKLGQENVVIVSAGGHTKSVNVAEMADYDNSGLLQGRMPEVIAFKGEQALTGALMEIIADKSKKVYVLTGKGQPSIEDNNSPVSEMLKALRRQNIELEPLHLIEVSEVPEDTDALLLLEQRYDFSYDEIIVLKKYWNKQARMMVLLEPTSSLQLFTAFLAELGVQRDDNRLFGLTKVAGFINSAAWGEFVPGSPITKSLIGSATTFTGASQSLTLLYDQAKQNNTRLQPLLQSAKNFWGETNYLENENVYFDPKEDKAPPLIMAASLEKGALQDNRVQVESSRMVVVSNSQFITNQGFSEINADFFIGSINWLLDRSELIGITPKSNVKFSLDLSESQLSRIFIFILIIIPGAIALLGFGSWLRRRH